MHHATSGRVPKIEFTPERIARGEEPLTSKTQRIKLRLKQIQEAVDSLAHRLNQVS